MKTSAEHFIPVMFFLLKPSIEKLHHNNGLKIMKTLICKIPPNLPLPKGGIIPLFGKEGRGEIF